MNRAACCLACAAALLGGCATGYDRVVLLPDADGHVGRLSVTRKDTTTEIDQPYTSARIGEYGRIRQAAMDAASVQREFAPALAALPPRPVSHTLYFVLDSDQLTPESAQQARAILADIAARPIADIVIIGHTDRVGELTYNDRLSLERATALREALIALGGDPARIRTAGRGEREPAIDTADEVPEPRNRRAVIDVR